MMLPAFQPLMRRAGVEALWAADSRSGLGISSGEGEVIDGATVDTWVPYDGATAAFVAGADPVLDELAGAGRFLIVFDDDARLVASLSGDVATAMLVVDAPAVPMVAERVLLTRDTSASTSKAAFEVTLTMVFA